MTSIRRILTWGFFLVMLSSVSACSSNTKPLFTEEEQKEMFKKEMSGELKALVELEKKFGMDHSQVRQMKMELGLDPDKPAAEQEL